MEYRFNQFRRANYNNYLITMDYTYTKLLTQSELLSGTYFYDNKLVFTGDNILQAMDSNNKYVKSYYCKFKVYKRDSEQIIQTRLFYTFKQEDNIQYLQKFTIPAGDPSEYVVCELVIKPNATYNELQFILERTLEDYNIQLEDPTKGGRTMNIEIESMKEIYNIFNYLKSTDIKMRCLLQIGVQGPANLLMSIDGEGVRTGRTGQYEINYGANIQFIGFVVEEGDGINFILDYQYRY